MSHYTYSLSKFIELWFASYRHTFHAAHSCLYFSPFFTRNYSQSANSMICYSRPLKKRSGVTAGLGLPAESESHHMNFGRSEDNNVRLRTNPISPLLRPSLRWRATWNWLTDFCRMNLTYAQPVAAMGVFSYVMDARVASTSHAVTPLFILPQRRRSFLSSGIAVAAATLPRPTTTSTSGMDFGQN